MQIVWKCIDLVRDRWQRPGRVQQIIFTVFWLIPVLILLTAPAHNYITLKNPTVDPLHDSHNLAQINNAIHLGFSVICAIVVLQLLFDIGKWIWESYRNRIAAG